jgi:hypothetical protein
LALAHQVIGAGVASGDVARNFIDLISEIEDSRVQVEVAPSRSVVADLVILPEKLVHRIDGRHAIFGFASKVLWGWTGPHVASVRHLGVAYEACLAAVIRAGPGLVLLYAARRLRAKSDLGDRWYHGGCAGKLNGNRVDRGSLSRNIATGGFCRRDYTAVFGDGCGLWRSVCRIRQLEDPTANSSNLGRKNDRLGGGETVVTDS